MMFHVRNGWQREPLSGRKKDRLMGVSRQLTTLTRIGFATRGLLYIVIGVLVIRTGRAEDTSGALEYLGRGGGQLLLGVMAAGLLAYGVWRLADTMFNIERHAFDRKGAVERLGAAASGLAHLLLAWQAVKLLQGVASTGDSARHGTQIAQDMPGGGTVVGLAGLVLLGVGVFQLVKAVKGSFLRHLDPSAARHPVVQWSGRAGYAARGFVFMITAYFLLRAGFADEEGAAGGTSQALSWLANPWDLVVATGLLGFGLFSLVEARFRRLADVPVDNVVRKAVSPG
jgi:hypothetical protein